MEKQKIILWGSYDLGKPRVRIMREALNAHPKAELIEIHKGLWEGVEDKSRLSIWRMLGIFLRSVFSYLLLIWQYLRAPKHKDVMIGYMGLLDILYIWPWAKIRGATVTWDLFLSIYDTVVNDRELFPPQHFFAKVIYGLEWLALKLADRVVLDTAAHADYIAELYNLPREKFSYVWVGAEQDHFKPASSRQNQEKFTVLFWGQMIPLHGVDAILEAMKLNDDPNIHWRIIGSGQEERKVLAAIEGGAKNLEWSPWVPYAELNKEVAEADVCLGIFGGSQKAASVIPNKVYQALAAGKQVITRDSAAINELKDEGIDGLFTVPTGDAQSLLNSVQEIKVRGAIDVKPWQPIEKITKDWQSLFDQR